MYLTGDNAKDPIGYAITTLKSTLAAGFAASPWKARFTPFGGIQMTDDPVEAFSWLQSKRPHIFLEVGNCAEDDAINYSRIIDGVRKPGARWNIQIELDIVVSMYSATAEVYAKAAIKDIIKRNYSALRDLGLEGSDIHASKADEAKAGRMCPHNFSCAIHLIY